MKLLGTLGVLCALAAPSTASAEPSDGSLVAAGLAMAPPTYALGVFTHEGSHAIAAHLVGAEVVGFHVLPGRDPRTGAFHFGRTDVRGLGPGAARKLFFAAPKITDLALLGGFAALLYAGGGANDGVLWPGNRYGQLALTVLATGWWVDFAKDVLAFSPHNDVTKLMSAFGFDSELARLPVRIVYAAVDVGLAALVWQGFRRTFAARDSDGASLTLTLLSTAF